MKERRQSVRINESLSVKYQVVKSFRMVTSRSKDISEGGICLPILQRLQPKVKLDIEITLESNARPIKAIGEIIWMREVADLRFPFIVGIKFLKIKPEALDCLRAYIKEKSPEAHIKLIEKEKE